MKDTIEFTSIQRTQFVVPKYLFRIPTIHLKTLKRGQFLLKDKNLVPMCPLFRGFTVDYYLTILCVILVSIGFL